MSRGKEKDDDYGGRVQKRPSGAVQRSTWSSNSTQTSGRGVVEEEGSGQTAEQQVGAVPGGAFSLGMRGVGFQRCRASVPRSNRGTVPLAGSDADDSQEPRVWKGGVMRRRSKEARAMDKSRGRTIRRHFIEERRRHIAVVLSAKKTASQDGGEK
ncbi:MAG: hypothetical protein ABGY10_04515 [bacterium]